MIEYANDNDKIIEFSMGNNATCLVLSGIAKGFAFKKEKKILGGVKITEIPFDSLPKEIKEYYKQNK